MRDLSPTLTFTAISLFGVLFGVKALPATKNSAYIFDEPISKHSPFCREVTAVANALSIGKIFGSAVKENPNPTDIDKNIFPLKSKGCEAK